MSRSSMTTRPDTEQRHHHHHHGDDDDDDELDRDRQCVLYYTNDNARYSAADIDARPAFNDADELDDEDDDDEDDEEDLDNVDDYVTVDEQGIGAGGLVIKLEDAAFVSRTAGELEVTAVDDDTEEAADVAESFFDAAGGLPVICAGRRRVLGDSRQQLVAADRRRTILDSCCWYGPVTSRCLASCVRSRPFLFFVYVILALVLLSSCVSLVLVVSLVARPYVRASGFINATCSPSVVSEGSRDGQTVMQTCSCGKGCNSKYRCIRIYVRYTPDAGAETSAVLYDDETALGRQVQTTDWLLYVVIAY